MSRPFAPGVPETRSFPLPTWERLQRQVLKEYGTLALLHSPPQGMEPLRRAIAAYVNLERGAQATPERVLVLTSSQQAMTLCATVLLDAGERIFIEDPVYHGARKAFDAAGLACVPVPLDDQGMQVARLHDAASPARAVFLTPSHQFPTGATLALDRRLAVIEWARQNQAWIIEDDYDSEFHYEGKPTACVQGLDPHGRTIYIGTFTKSLFPGLRIGFMVVPTALAPALALLLDRAAPRGRTADQRALAEFIVSGQFALHLRRMRRLYREQTSKVRQLVAQHFPPGTRLARPQGGYFVWLELPRQVDTLLLHQQALAHGISIAPGPIFSAKRAFPNYFRLNFGHPATPRQDQALATLGRLIKRQL